MESNRVRQRKKLVLVIALLVAVYVGSYLWLSRRGYAEADRCKMPGFCYFTPEDSNTWQYKNYGCVILFCPLNMVDRCLGFGREPAHVCFFRLSK